MNKLHILSLMLVSGMVAHLTACMQDAETSAIPSVDENHSAPPAGGDIAPQAVGPILEPLPLPLPISPAPPFVLDEAEFDGYFTSQGADQPADTGNNDDDDCGDGEIDGDEECDDGGEEGGSCDDNCQIIREGCTIHEGVVSTYIYCTGGNENWSNAQEVCQSFGPFNLATISSSAENTFLGSFITQDAWIGFNDIAVEGTFVWVSGIPVTFTNWQVGEPNNSGNQDCTQFYPTLLTWDDLGCAESRGFVCELGPTNTVALTQPLVEESEDESEAPVEQPAEEELEIPAEELLDEIADQPADEQAEQPADEQAEQPADEPAEQPIEEQPIEEQPIDVPAEAPSEQEAEEGFEQPSDD